MLVKSILSVTGKTGGKALKKVGKKCWKKGLKAARNHPRGTGVLVVALVAAWHAGAVGALATLAAAGVMAAPKASALAGVLN